MLSERGGRVHQLRIVHPDLVGAGKPTARAVNQEAVSAPLLRRHLVNGNLGIASERRCAAHRRASCAVRQRPHVQPLLRRDRYQGDLHRGHALLKTRTYGRLAIITGTAVYEVTSGGQDRTVPLRFTAIWAKRPSGLEFVSWQSTGIPPRQ